jgi:hypothetical protein
MYVDESGDNGYPSPGTPFPNTGGPTPYFARAGVIVHSWKWCGVDQRICQFKESRFLKWDSEIKANHIRTGTGAFTGWPPADRKHFLLDLLDTINREMDVSIVCVVIDKTKIDTTQRPRFTRPAVRSLELLLERFNDYLLHQKDRTGAVILDSVEAKADDELRYFQNYLRNFSQFLDSRRIIEGTFFLPSHTSTLLQLADVCTNVLYRNVPEEVIRIESRIVSRKSWP